MKYLNTFTINEKKLKDLGNKLLDWFFVKLFGKNLDKKIKELNPELYEATIRLMDKRIDFINLIKTEDEKLYDSAYRMYNLFYPKNDILQDCEILKKDQQSQLWKEKEGRNEIANAIYLLDKFIDFVKKK